MDELVWQPCLRWGGSCWGKWNTAPHSTQLGSRDKWASSEQATVYRFSKSFEALF